MGPIAAKYYITVVSEVDPDPHYGKLPGSGSACSIDPAGKNRRKFDKKVKLS